MYYIFHLFVKTIRVNATLNLTSLLFRMKHIIWLVYEFLRLVTRLIKMSFFLIYFLDYNINAFDFLSFLLLIHNVRLFLFDSLFRIHFNLRFIIHKKIGIFTTFQYLFENKCVRCHYLLPYVSNPT